MARIPDRTPGQPSGPAPRLSNHELRGSDVPANLQGDDDEAGRTAVSRFAHTFNAYAAGGGPSQLATVVTAMRDRWEDGGQLPSSLGDLRTALFLWHRADRHAGGGGPTGDEVAWINALLAAIRSAVAN